MQIEVGKVYKCGDTFVYIEYKSQTLQKLGSCYKYFGIRCDVNGKLSEYIQVGRFAGDGDYHRSNPTELRFILCEALKRETIKVGDSVFYKDEFEAATKNLKRVEE